MTAPVLRNLLLSLGAVKNIPKVHSLNKPPIHLRISEKINGRHIAVVQWRRRSQWPDLRANPYSEVTDLICRLPLPNLLYWPETYNLRDLLRITVRPPRRTKRASSFSRTITCAPDTSHTEAVYPIALPPTEQIYSGDTLGEKAKITLPRTCACVTRFPNVTSI